MARVTVPEGAENQPTVQSGTYSEGCRVVGAEARTVPGENKDNETWLDIGVGIPSPAGMVFAHTSPFGRYHTRLTTSSGSKAGQFVANLGFNPSDFDTDDLKGVDVVVEVNTRAYKTQSGEEGVRVEITNIGKPV